MDAQSEVYCRAKRYEYLESANGLVYRKAKAKERVQLPVYLPVQLLITMCVARVARLEWVRMLVTSGWLPIVTSS